MLNSFNGDRAKNLLLGINTNRLSSGLKTLTKEAASGEVADLGSHLHGDTIYLNGVERKISLIDQYNRNSQEALMVLKWQQEVLNTVNDAASSLSLKIRTLPQAYEPVAVSDLSEEAMDRFSAAVNQLNNDVAGRYIFSGLNVNERPLLSAEQMLEKIVNLAAGSNDSEKIFQSVSEWFEADAGGFAAFAYAGTLDSEIKFEVAEGRTIDVGASAISPEIKGLLKGLALAAISGHEKIANGDFQTSKRLLELGAEEIWRNELDLNGKIARIGAVQEDVEIGQAMNSSALSTLEVARNEIRQVDLYETSSAIIETETQLRNLYMLTARLSNLSLAEYLR